MGARGPSAFRRSPHTTRSSRNCSDSLVVTHPFHPLSGQRLPILFERRGAGGRLYICAGGVLGTTAVPESWTDRGPPPAQHRVTLEGLATLATTIVAIEEC